MRIVYTHDVDRSGALFETVKLQSPVLLHVTSDLLTWRVYVDEKREYTAFGGDLEPAEEQGSWALHLLRNLTGVLGHKPQGRELELSVLIDNPQFPNDQGKRDGIPLSFSNRTGTGALEITSASPVGFLFLKLALFAFAFVGARLLVRLLPSRRVAFLVPALGLLALLIPAGPGLASVLTAMFYGVLLSGALSFLGFLAQSRSEAASKVAAPPAPPGAPTGGPQPVTAGGA